MRLKLRIAYDGRPFLGWQTQLGGHTVQDCIQQALARVAKQPLKLHGAGRTDAGVHALGQIAHFDAPPASRMNRWPDCILRAFSSCSRTIRPWDTPVRAAACSSHADISFGIRTVIV